MKEKVKRLRATPARGIVGFVDREARALNGVAVAQAVEALGHDLLLDETTIDQVVQFGNRATKGIKSRFTHPGLSNNGLGKFLGRAKKFWKDTSGTVPTARATLYLSRAASKSPNGDLAGYVMDLAEEDPEAFGNSIVFKVNPTWKRPDGTEVPMFNVVDGEIVGRNDKPDDATTKKPFARVIELSAVDVVDEPAANRDGMFSTISFGRWPSGLTAELFRQMDDLLTHYQISPGRAYQFAMQYFEARGIAGSAYDESKEADLSGVTALAEEGALKGAVNLDHTKEESMDEELREEGAPDAAETQPEAQPQSQAPALSGHKAFEVIVEAVLARLDAEKESEESEVMATLEEVVGAMETLSGQVETLGEQVQMNAIAIGALQGEKPVTRKVEPSQAPSLSARLSRLSGAVTVPDVEEVGQPKAPGVKAGNALGFEPTGDPAKDAVRYQQALERMERGR